MARIAICTPHNGEVKADYAFSMGKLLLASQPKHELELFGARGSSIALNRMSIADNALAWGAEFLLWIDSDHIFPADTLARLLAHGHDIVGCNQPRRAFGQPPTAVIVQNGQLRYVVTGRKEVEARLVQRVHALGLGVCLMRAGILRRLERPWFESWPGGEDSYFFAKLSKLQVPVYLDHALSWEIGHLGDHIFSNADVVVDPAQLWAGGAPDEPNPV
jgi:hypothetical protein